MADGKRRVTSRQRVATSYRSQLSASSMVAMKATTGRAILSARTPARLSVGFEAQCPDLRRTGWFAVCVVFMLFVRHRLDPSGMFRLR